MTCGAASRPAARRAHIAPNRSSFAPSGAPWLRKIVGAPFPKGAVLYEGPAKVASVGAIPYYGFGFRFFPYAEDRPDRIHLRVSNITTFAFVGNFPSIWKGEYEDLESTFDYLVEDVTLEMDPPTSFQIGGDVRGERSRVRVRMTEPIRIVDFYAPPRG